jgi:hypothetical protein
MSRPTKTQDWWLKAQLKSLIEALIQPLDPDAARRLQAMVEASEWTAAIEGIVALRGDVGAPVPRGFFEVLTSLAKDLGMGPDAIEPLRDLVVDGPVASDTTAALRARSMSRLKEGFNRHVVAASAETSWDPRGEMLDLTPFLDCTRRLGFDPAVELGPIAATGAPWLRKTFDAFVRREDVTLAAFGWSIVETPDGPAYRFAWPAWPLKDRPSSIGRAE